MNKLLNFIQLILAFSGLICTIILSVMFFEQSLFYIIIAAIINFLVGLAVWISFKEFINKD